MALPPLPTAAIADACVRLKVPERVLALRPVLLGTAVAGPVLPVRHSGSVDVFFEALQKGVPGSILVIDNEARLDEGCIGDLTALEARHHGIAGIVVDGCHRDSAALRTLAMPVWSRGSFPFGPRGGRPRPQDALTVAHLVSSGAAHVDGFTVSSKDVVAADDDGVVFVSAAHAPQVWELAGRIQKAEAEQAARAQRGEGLCEQFRFGNYLEERAREPNLTFRAHLRSLGKSIEE